MSCLFDYSSSSFEGGDRGKALFDHVLGERAAELDNYEKLVSLLQLVGFVAVPVLVLDEVEGYFGNPEAGLQVCGFLNALHQACNKLSVIISTNGDIWETAFKPRLSSGLKDRLTDFVVDLKPLPQDLAMLILRGRDRDFVKHLEKELDLDVGVIYPRGLIKKSAAIWEDYTKAAAESEDGLDVNGQDALAVAEEVIRQKNVKQKNASSSPVVFSEAREEGAK